MQIPTTARVPVLVVTNRTGIQRSVDTLLSWNPHWEVCGHAENYREAVEKILELGPHVVVLDVNALETNCTEAIHEIRRIAPTIKTVIFGRDAQRNP